MSAFSNNLIRWCQLLDISSKVLAEKTGIPQVTIFMYMSGEKEPDENDLEKLSDFFNIPTKILTSISDKDNMKNISLEDILVKLSIESNDTSLPIEECIEYHKAKLSLMKVYYKYYAKNYIIH